MDINDISLFNMNQVANIECVLKAVDPLELLSRIQKFRSLNIKEMNDSELHSCVYDVLCNKGIFSYLCNIGSYPKGTLFYRVKKLCGSSIPDKRFSKETDYWETPSCYLHEYGRLNRPHESLLYTCPEDPYLAIQETNIQNNDYFAVIKYKALSDIKVNIIGGTYDYNACGITDKKAIMIHELYNDFLKTEFSRDVGKGTEYLYKISEMIAKNFFDLPPRIAQDGWAYSSVKDKGKYNVCFRPEIAHEVLELSGAMICQLEDCKKFKVFCVAVGADYNGKILFYRLGSNEQIKVFPEIIQSDKAQL